jgi:hypothetical protein
MVGKALKSWMILLVITLVLLMPLSVHLALAQGVGEEGDYSISEEYLIEIYATGDAHITDTLTYDPTWFDQYSYIFEENPNLLTRRYRADSNVGEVEDFDVDIDTRDATITVTFDTPGLAYNLAGGWTVFGYGNYQLDSEGNDEVVLQSDWTVTNEFSLFEPMSLQEQVIIDLPEGAQNAGYDEATGAIEYDLAYDTGGGGVLAENKTLFIILFAVIMALSLILLLYVFTRKASEPAAMETVPTGAPPAAAPLPPMASQPQTAQPQAGASAGETAATPKFCKKCGHPRGSEEEKFCRKCGAPHS